MQNLKMLKLVLTLAIFSICLMRAYTQASLGVSSRSMILGLETGCSIIYGKFPDTEEKYHDFAMRLNPYWGYSIAPKFSLGIAGSVEFVNSSYAPQEPAHGVGAFAQYRLPVKYKGLLENRLALVARTMYLKTNFYLNDGKFVKIVDGGLHENMLGLDLGLNIRIFKQFYLQQFFRHDIFFGRNKVFTHRVAFEYYFR